MKRLVRPAIGAGLLLALAATPVLATHTHAILLEDGRCVVVADGAGEDEVRLPASVFEQNPNVDVPPSGAVHPLHVLVHRGVPGDQRTWVVYTPGICDPVNL
ncbi:MAG TPA: hypothetical protein VFY23_04480 [Candidatus Limnocylindrales bacterium]|nr:hypothetical protein [Candidatus Limnocylindrales bacterium]